MNKKILGIFLVFILILSLLPLSNSSVYSNPLPPKTIYGYASRSDGGSVSGAHVSVIASGYPTKTTTVENTVWYVDVGPETGIEWPDGTVFTVYISMNNGWAGQITSNVTGSSTFAGNVILYPPIPPISADAGGVYFGLINQEIDFLGSAYGGVQPYKSWFWDFGDGNWTNEKNPSHSYSEIGTYIVILTVTDSDMHTSSDYTNAIISLGDVPIVDANGPYYGKVDEEIQLQGDVIGGASPYIWFWDFGDGGSSIKQNPVHKYIEEGKYIVILTVTDDKDKIDTSNTFCYISNNNPPVKPVISGPISGKPNTSYRSYI